MGVVQLNWPFAANADELTWDALGRARHRPWNFQCRSLDASADGHEKRREQSHACA
ncbi:hypothetical protein ABZU32_27425 [Sphaerisporangium sp. NPDC005288]|uniref:hypothetical protein n=1 Tax=Sphaerisporangium sp. NPDC005288 TaxID=3155114 RepID=UPI0033A4DECE